MSPGLRNRFKANRGGREGGDCTVKNLERLGSLTSELSSNLVKSIVIPPGGLLGWFSRQRAERGKEAPRPGRIEQRSDGRVDVSTATIPAGPVLLLGGAPVPDEAVVESIHLVGGRSARVAVIPAAAEADPAASGAEAMRLFTRFGMKKVEVFDLTTRGVATSPDWCAQLAEYEAVVLCGENPSRGLQTLQATLAAVTLHEMLAAGKLLVGLQAGAAILGSRLFSDGESAELTVGLGLLPGLVVEAGASHSDRLAKSLVDEETALMLGVGLDPGVALMVQGGEARVVGEGSVTFLDPRERAMAVGEADGMRLHLLTEGQRLNLRTRRPAGPVTPVESLTPVAR